MTEVGGSRTVLTEFAERRRADPGSPAVHYYGRSISREELDHLSDQMARCLADLGVTRSSRVAVSLRNTPVFAVAMLATWKLGAVLVPVNPSSTAAELARLLSDCGAAVIVAHPEAADDVTKAVTEVEQRVELVWSDPRDLAGHLAWPWSSGHEPPDDGIDVVSMLSGSPPPAAAWHGPRPDDLALLVYTSGTTGPSRAVMLTHANIGYHAIVTPGWLGLAAGDTVLATAPFFHITGLALHLVLGLGHGLPIVMTYAFEPKHHLDLIGHYAPSYTIAAIPAFVALAERAVSDDVARAALASVVSPFSGGITVPATAVDGYEREFGPYIRNAYGLTETASVCVAVPAGLRAPIEPGSGATSIGRPLPGVSVSIRTDDGSDAPPGVGGEIIVRGPQVGAGYWSRPTESSDVFRPDGLHTGDIGIIDDDGWVYLVDRKNDLIVINGYKVLPRDVEHVLSRHLDVSEVAVIGVSDDHRGEYVVAYVVPRAGVTIAPEVLNRHCREYLSAHMCPRRYEIVTELPKSPTGKVLRRRLRDID